MEYSLVSPVLALRERPTLPPAELARERQAFIERRAVRQLQAWAHVLLANDVWDMHNRRRRPSLFGASRPELEAAALKRWPDMAPAKRARLVGFAVEFQAQHHRSA